jgi:LEA14-like dessication related protein
MHRETSVVRSLFVLTAAALTLAGCAWMQRTDPPRVTVLGVEPLASEGLEARMQLKLRVQNPNDTPIEYNGISVELNVQGKSLATGVSNQSGTVPAFGEAVITVPVTVSVWAIAGQAMGLLSGTASLEKITYAMQGKLSSTNFGALRFESQGELNLADLTTGGK